MDVKRILWPTDFSENAAQTLPVVNPILTLAAWLIG